MSVDIDPTFRAQQADALRAAREQNIATLVAHPGLLDHPQIPPAYKEAARIVLSGGDMPDAGTLRALEEMGGTGVAIRV